MHHSLAYHFNTTRFHTDLKSIKISSCKVNPYMWSSLKRVQKTDLKYQFLLLPAVMWRISRARKNSIIQGSRYISSMPSLCRKIIQGDMQKLSLSESPYCCRFKLLLGKLDRVFITQQGQHWKKSMMGAQSYDGCKKNLWWVHHLSRSKRLGK